MDKILLVGDIHIGVRGDSNIYLEIFSKWIDDFLIPTIQEQDITHVFLLGDLWDNRNSINIKSLNVALNKINHIINQLDNVNIYLIMGNHDIYYKTTREVNSLSIFKNFNSDRIKIINSIETIQINDKKIICCPWIINQEEIDHLYSLKGDLCLGHFEINGFDMVKGVTETKGLSQKKLKENFKKTFSGHFHLHQNQGNITYIGSAYQINWNDWNNQKGVISINLKNMHTKFIENKISPTYEKIFFSKLKNKTENLDKVKGNFIQLIIDEECEEKVINKLSDIIEKYNPISFVIDGLSVGAKLTIEELEEGLSSPIEYLNNYIKSLKIEDIDFKYDKNILSKMIKDIYDKCSN